MQWLSAAQPSSCQPGNDAPHEYASPCGKASASPAQRKANSQKRAKNALRAWLPSTESAPRAPRPGDDLDRKFNSTSSVDPDNQPPPSAYQRLAGAFGVEALNAAERVLVVALGTMLIAFLASGLAISSEAFFKASGKEIPDNVEAILLSLEQAFTPTIVIFLALSSVFGLYKQSQLSYGASSYSALSKDEETN